MNTTVRNILYVISFVLGGIGAVMIERRTHWTVVVGLLLFTWGQNLWNHIKSE